MYLIIDAGNTRCKIALFDKEGTLTENKTVDTATFEDLKSFTSGKVIDGYIISKVGTSFDGADFLEELPYGMELDSETTLPYHSLYESMETLGNDRKANAAAAHSLYPYRPVLVIDAGTCITYDLIDRGTYQGGAITPGVRMKSKALHNFTHKLPLVEPDSENPEILVGKSTRDAILSGVFTGTRMEIEGYIQAFKYEYPGLKALLTGGDRGYFEKDLKNLIFADPFLTMKGLHAILRFHGY